MNWVTASRLTTWLPHKNWSGTSDLNRESLGPRPSGLIRFPSPRMSKIWSERLESNQRPRASETRALIRLSYAHKRWNRRPESNRHFVVQRIERFGPNEEMPVRFRPPVPAFVGVAQSDESAGFRSPRPLVRFQPLTPDL